MCATLQNINISDLLTSKFIDTTLTFSPNFQVYIPISCRVSADTDALLGIIETPILPLTYTDGFIRTIYHRASFLRSMRLPKCFGKRRLIFLHKTLWSPLLERGK